MKSLSKIKKPIFVSISSEQQTSNLKLATLLIIGSYFVLSLLMTIVAPINDNSLLLSSAIMLHTLFTCNIFFHFNKNRSIIYTSAYALRIIILFIDLFLNEFVSIPHSGTDTELFYRLAIKASEHTPFSSETQFASMYGRFVGTIFYFIGPVRLWAQYLNVIVGTLLVLCIDYMCIQLRLKEKNRKKAVLLAAFLPTSIIMSSILLREIIPTLLVALSLSAFVRWYQRGKTAPLASSFLFLFLASAFHSGVIGLAFGYFFLVAFYDHKRRKLQFSLKSVASFIIVISGSTFVFLVFGDTILYKFNKVEEVNDLLGELNNRGGSAYLTGLQINSPLQFILYAPIRAFYFLFSPLPMNWRGFSDLFTFFLDSTFYLYASYLLIKNFKQAIQHKLLAGIAISLLAASLIFGAGVGNAGTAMRHRQKLSPFFIILLFGIKETQNEKRKTKKIVLR